MAGEPSGDVLGARLMAALQAEVSGDLRFAGVGGPLMAAAGLESLFPITDITLMGFAEVLPKIPLVLRRVRETARHALALAPDIMVTIDVPGFSGRLADRLSGRTFPLVHYVAPTVWAWRPGRARTLARRIDHLLTLLPFEPPWFEREGLPATFVGHPVVESGVGEGDGTRFRKRQGLAPDRPLLCVLPGSRRGEVARLLPVFGAVVAALAADRPDLHLAVPTVPAVAETVRTAVAAWALPATVVTGDADKHDAFAASRAALAASGTVSLELAIARVPHVIAYAVNPLSAMIARRLIRVRYASLVNILEDRPVVPEFLQDRCTAGHLLPAVARLLDDPAARLDQQAVGAKIGRDLGGPGAGLSPSRAAARVVAGLMAGSLSQGTLANPGGGLTMNTAEATDTAQQTDRGFKMLHTMIRVHDLEKSIDFYTRLLGMKLFRKKDYPGGEFTLAFVGYGNEKDHHVIELTHNWGQEEAYNLGEGFGHMALGVRGIYEVCETLAENGVKITRPPGPMKHGSTVIAFIEDPDGYKIELIELEGRED